MISCTPAIDVGRFVAASLANPSGRSSHIHFTKNFTYSLPIVSHNKVIRVQSFSATGRDVLTKLEQETATNFEVTHKTAAELEAEPHTHLVNFGGYNGSDFGPLDNDLFPEVTPTSLDNVVKVVVNLNKIRTALCKFALLGAKVDFAKARLLRSPTPSS